MSKKYIICGVSRAWKSTLASAIAQKTWGSIIPTDPLVSAFQRAFPDLGITHKIGNNNDQYFDVCKKFTPFMIEYICSIDDELDAYVIEWFHIDFWLLKERFWDKYNIIVMGFPGAITADKFSKTRSYDGETGDWTNELSDKDLENALDWFIQLSHVLQKKAIELWIPFIDTSVNHEEELQKYVATIE